MEHTSRPPLGPFNPWTIEHPDTLASPTILVVEDDEDIREMLATLLGMADFRVVACDTAEGALDALREQTFDVVLTDYALPHRTGLWLLRAAESEGLVDGTPVLMMTAHPDVAGLSPYEVIQKPFDLDDLVERVRYRVEGDGPRRRRVTPVMPTSENGGGQVPECPDPVELILYVSSRSPHSAAAIRNIRKVLDRFNSSRVKLTVCDLSLEPHRGAEDSVAFTPTLVRRHPGPRTFILGHMANPELLLELLADCETEG